MKRDEPPSSETRKRKRKPKCTSSSPTPVGMRHLYIGPSNTGKTTLVAEKLKALISKDKKADIFICSPSYPHQKLYTQFKKRVKLWADSLNEETMGHIYRKVLKNRDMKRPRNIVIIIDDFGDSGYFRGRADNFGMRLIREARQLGVHVVVVVQRMTEATPLMRTNADSVTCFVLANDEDRKTLRKEFAGEIKWPKFREMLDECWREPYGYISIDKSNPYDRKYMSKSGLLKSKTTEEY